MATGAPAALKESFMITPKPALMTSIKVKGFFSTPREQTRLLVRWDRERGATFRSLRNIDVRRWVKGLAGENEMALHKFVGRKQ